MKKIVTIVCLLWGFAIVGSAQDSLGTEILSDKGTYALDYSDLTNLRWGFDREYRVVVRSAPDLAFLKFVSIPVDQGFNEDLKTASVEIRSRDGSRISYDLSNFKKEPFDVEITDYTLEVDGLKVTDTLVVKYNSIADLSNRMHRWDLQYAYPVRHSELSFLMPEAFTYVDHLTDDRFMTSEMAISNTVNVSRSQRLRLKGVRLTCENIPAYVEESMMPSLMESRPAYFFSMTDLAPVNYDAFLADWSTQCSDLIVNDYWGKQFRVRSNYSWLLQEARDVVKLNTDERTKAWKCYQLIHRLFSWDGGMGLFPSHTIKEMQTNREVNKSAMNQALLALLKACDLRAFPILVNTLDQAPVQEEIPDIFQFNHFIIVVGIGDEALYLDAGDQNLPIGLVDQSIRKSPSILIRNYKASWVSISDFSSSSMFHTEVTVAADGSATGVITCSFQGYDAHSERQKLAEDKQARFWKDRAANLSRAIRIDSVRFRNVANGMKPLHTKVYFHFTSADAVEFLPFFYSFFPSLDFSESVRKNDFNFPFHMNENSSLKIIYPDTYEVEFDDQSRKLSMEKNECTFEYITESVPGQLDLRGSVKVNTQTIPAEHYRALSTIFGEINAVLQQAIVLRKK